MLVLVRTYVIQVDSTIVCDINGKQWSSYTVFLNCIDSISISKLAIVVGGHTNLFVYSFKLLNL